VLVVSGGSEGWGRSAGAAQALLDTLLGAKGEDAQEEMEFDDNDALLIAEFHKAFAKMKAEFGGAGSEGAGAGQG
jgi:hypothetical protein